MKHTFLSSLYPQARPSTNSSFIDEINFAKKKFSKFKNEVILKIINHEKGS
jgi:hypothetical protein